MRNEELIKSIIAKTDYEKGDKCIVSISDIHLENDNSYGIFNSLGVNSDLENKVKIFEEAIDVADYLKSPIIVGGDLLDQRAVDGITSAYCAKCINNLNHKHDIIDFIIICGNHEYFDRAANFSSLSQYSYFTGSLDLRKRGHIVTSYQKIPIRMGKTKIVVECLPANQKIEKQLKELLPKFRVNKGKYDYYILTLHGGIEGADLGSMKAPDGISAKLIQECGEIFDWVICGDFHKFQFVNGLRNVYYCGAPKQMNTSEIGQKRGYQIVNLTKGTLNFIRSKAPVFKKIEWVHNEYEHPFLKDPKKYISKIKNRIFTVVMSGTSEQISKYPFNEKKKLLLQCGALNVFSDPNPTHEQRNAVRINKDLPINEIIVKYVEMRDYKLAESIKQRHIKILKKYAME